MLLFSDPANPEADREPLSLSLGPGGAGFRSSITPHVYMFCLKLSLGMRFFPSTLKLRTLRFGNMN